MKKVTILCGTLGVTSLFALGNFAKAGGFALIENGASGLGNAYAGASAVSADSSTVWFNPAGMLELGTRQFTVAGHILGVDNSYSDRGSTLVPALGGGAVTGTASDSPGGTTVIPNLFYVHPVNDRLAVGMGITAPFGSATKYDRGWIGRYLSVESAVSVVDFNPTVAYKINEQLTLGGGISLQYMTVTLGSAVDSAAACLSFAGTGALPALDCINAGLSPNNAATDTYANIEGDSTAFTFNLSALYKPQEGTNIGIAYRHKVDHDLEGDADFTVDPGLQTALTANSLPLFVDGGATAVANLPAQLAFSVSHMANEKLQLLGDITWTGWSSFQELRVNYNNPAQPDTVSPQEWDDVFRLSAGVNYQLDDKWTLRGGVAYDQEAIPSVQLRTPRIPGNDRTWVAVGAGYNISPRASVDVGFTHLMVDETPIDNTGSSQTLRGVYDASINILSAQFNWNFN